MDHSEIRDTENPGPGTPEGEGSGLENSRGSHAGNGAEEIKKAEEDNAVIASPQGEAISACHSERSEESRDPSASPQDDGFVPRNDANPLHVKLSIYDGPLDLLLELIRKNEMDIYDIPVAEITRQYLEYIEHMRQLDLEVAGEFIVMAATLIYIKSKMLLPMEKMEEEDEEGQDPRAELVRKLLEYQAFKEAAKELGVLEGERGQFFTRQIADYYLANLDPEDVSIDSFSANLYDLLSAFQAFMAKAGRFQRHEVFEQIVTIEEKIDDIKGRLETERKVSFFDLFNEGWTRNLLIVTFLALLEIVRSKFARVTQEKEYADIVIEKIETTSTS